MPEFDIDMIANHIRTLKTGVEKRHYEVANDPGFLGLVAVLSQYDHGKAHKAKTVELEKLRAKAAALQDEVEEHAQGAGLAKPRRGRPRAGA